MILKLNPFAFFDNQWHFPLFALAPTSNIVLVRQEILEQAQDIAQRCREHWAFNSPRCSGSSDLHPCRSFHVWCSLICIRVLVLAASASRLMKMTWLTFIGIHIFGGAFPRLISILFCKATLPNRTLLNSQLPWNRQARYITLQAPNINHQGLAVKINAFMRPS
jgi:hypothetical protein